jgi:hypothetical protein
MNARQRVEAALNHQTPDRVPLDLGATAVSGMQVASVYQLRQALELDPPGTPVKVVEPYQMLGEIAPDLMDRLGVDTVGLGNPKGFFGFENTDWKEWQLFDGTPVLVPGLFNTEPGPSGDILQYPEGDRSVSPSARMPAGGYYFDSIVRQPPIDEEKLDPADNLQEFGPLSDDVLEHYRRGAEELSATGRAIIMNVPGTAFGDIALVPVPWMKDPRGIRDVAEWYMSTAARFDYVFEVFERQCDIALANLAKVYEVVGDRVTAIFTTGTDFGTQNGPFISRQSYTRLFQPFHRRLNDWIHENTPWKVFIHSCGSIIDLLPDIIDAGFDILNPVQCSARGMDATTLKERFGDRLTFWGGGIDTQKTLPFGTPEDIRREATERVEIFGAGGGFVFNPVHNVQANTPRENLLALYEAVNAARGFSPDR